MREACQAAGCTKLIERERMYASVAAVARLSVPKPHTLFRMWDAASRTRADVSSCEFIQVWHLESANPDVVIKAHVSVVCIFLVLDPKYSYALPCGTG